MQNMRINKYFMKNGFQLFIMKNLQICKVLILLFNILLLNSCTECSSKNNNISERKEPEPLPPKGVNEVIVFLGKSGVGKSTLCNSIFQKIIFRSGTSNINGVTAKQQQYLYNNKLYIDTPALAEVEINKITAGEIEKALKQDNNYKIVFVATLNGGRIDEYDFVAINKICDAIKIPFDYGLIFNKVTKRIIQKIGEGGIKKYLKALNKPPVSILFLEKDDEIEDADNLYFSDNSENIKRLTNFLSKLKTTKLLPTDISEINISNFQEEIDNMKNTLKKLN